MTEVYDIINSQREAGLVPAADTDTERALHGAPRLMRNGGATRVSLEPRPSDPDAPASAPKRQSGPQPLPSVPGSDTRRIPKRISGGQPTQNPAPAMNHHYPNAQQNPTEPGPAQPVNKRQSGPQPLPHAARKTPPVLQARHTPPVLHAAQPPLPEKRDTQVLQKPQSKVQSRKVAAAREAYTPRWYQFHIRTLVLATCVAAGLGYMNFRAPAIVGCQTVFKQDGETKVTSYVTTIRGRGWPLTHTQTVETSDPILAMEAFQKSAPQGFGGIGSRNILICLALTLGAGVLCEVLMRRSDASELETTG